MATIELGGVGVAYEATPPARPGAPTLVWGHGLTSSRAHEDEAGLFALAPALAAAGVGLVRYDAPGHGATGGRRDDAAYRWDALAATMLAVADRLAEAPVVLGGASMGCASALFAALERSARPAGSDQPAGLLRSGPPVALALAVPPTAWDARPAQAELYRAAAAVVDVDGPAGLARLVRGAPPAAGYGARGAELAELSARHIEQLDPALLGHVLRGAAASDLPPVDALGRLDLPCLVLALRGDPTHPLASAEAIAAAVPGAELVVADGLDDVARWPEQVAAFLAALA